MKLQVEMQVTVYPLHDPADKRRWVIRPDSRKLPQTLQELKTTVGNLAGSVGALIDDHFLDDHAIEMMVHENDAEALAAVVAATVEADQQAERWFGQKFERKTL